MAKKIKARMPRKDVEVKSRIYGNHTRAARGSKTPAKVNDVLAGNAQKTSTLNAAAKAVYDILKLYTGYFREGQLWQIILGRMRKTGSLEPKDLLCSLEYLEINTRYRLTRFGNVPAFSVKQSKGSLHITMQPFMPPVLYKKDNSYQYELIVLLFDGKGICVQHSIQQTAWLYAKDPTGKYAYAIKQPKTARYYLLCLHLKGGVDGVATDTYTSRGMMIVECGAV